MRGSQIVTGGGFAILACALFGLAVIYLLEWRDARTIHKECSEGYGNALSRVENQFNLMNSRIGGLFEAMSASQARFFDEVAVRLEAASATAAVAVTGAPVAAAGESENDSTLAVNTDAVEDLPQIPHGVDPERLLRDKELGDLVLELRQDEARCLGPVETQRAYLALTEARAQMDVLDRKVQLAIIEGMEVLRGRGDYVEYAQGEKYESAPGVISFGEDLGALGMRIFYLFPEEFPDIYALRARKSRVSEDALRSLMAIINAPIENIPTGG